VVAVVVVAVVAVPVARVAHPRRFFWRALQLAGQSEAVAPSPAGRSLLPAGIVGSRFATKLTDPDARSMATSGKDTGIVGYNVQAAVDTKIHLIVAHEVTNVGTDRHQRSNIAEQARTEMGVETLDAVADRGYYASEEIRACEEAGITVTLPKPMTSNAKAAGRFGKPGLLPSRQWRRARWRCRRRNDGQRL
jgi:hypothetical protein